MAEEPVALLKRANEVMLEVLAQVQPEQMTLPTVNDEWDVRALINHVVAGSGWAAENVRTGQAPRPSGDAIGERAPLDAYREAAEAMIAAFEEPGALERTVMMPWGEFPAAKLAEFRFVDLYAHAWDLAQATGQDTNLSPELAEIALNLTRQTLTGDRTTMPFKDEVHVPDHAPLADRLAGFLGKPV